MAQSEWGAPGLWQVGLRAVVVEKLAAGAEASPWSRVKSMWRCGTTRRPWRADADDQNGGRMIISCRRQRHGTLGVGGTYSGVRWNGHHPPI